jgi:threonine synthase
MAFSDEQTLSAIREVSARHSYTMDPHGAVAWLAARNWRERHPGAATITLETAHPAKFPEVAAAAFTTDALAIPERLAILAHREKIAVSLGNGIPDFREWLVSSL